MLTVPLLVLAGVPGASANGSNRVGVLASNAASAASFRRLGIKGVVHAAPILIPVVAGSLFGSIAISRLTDEEFEIAFGLLMVPLIILSVCKPPAPTKGRTWGRPVVVGVFLLIGIYGGAVQAGVGLVLLAALTRSGFDLVTANSIKVVIILTVTLVALPVFVWEGKVSWLPAVILAAGFAVGGWLGAHVAVRGGAQLIRPVMVIAAIGLAARLLGFIG